MSPDKESQIRDLAYRLWEEEGFPEGREMEHWHQARERVESEQSNAPTADQLRHEIDRGETGDKVPGNDPAAAPLGTDDEAAGTPSTPEQIRQAREQELGRGVKSEKMD